MAGMSKSLDTPCPVTGRKGSKQLLFTDTGTATISKICSSSYIISKMTFKKERLEVIWASPVVYCIVAGQKEFSADLVCDGCLFLLCDHEMQL